jgi:hypothetical protein
LPRNLLRSESAVRTCFRFTIISENHHHKDKHSMAPPAAAVLQHLSNALATPEQLSSSSSSIDGVTPDLEASLRFAGAQLTHAAGILLRLSQDIIAQAIVTFTRFWIGPEGGSMRIYSVKVCSPRFNCCVLVAN